MADGRHEFPTAEYTADTTRWVYSTAPWQAAYEESGFGADGSVDSTLEWVYGLTYIDDLLAMQMTRAGSSSELAAYACCDAQYNVVARLEDRGAMPRITVRVVYSEYGLSTMYRVSSSCVTEAGTPRVPWGRAIVRSALR